jgi:hypothetical protein
VVKRLSVSKPSVILRRSLLFCHPEELSHRVILRSEAMNGYPRQRVLLVSHAVNNNVHKSRSFASLRMTRKGVLPSRKFD